MHGSYQELFNRINAHCGLVIVDTYEEQKLVRELRLHFDRDNIQFWSATQGLHEFKREDDPKVVKIYDDMFEASRCRSTPARDGRPGQPTVGNILNALDVIEDDSRKKIDQQSNTTMKHIYILRDADKFFNNPMSIRKIRDILYLVSTASSSMIICGPGIKVPTELEKDAPYIELGLPDVDEIRNDILQSRICHSIDAYNEDIEAGGTEGDPYDTGFDLDQVARACGGLTEDEIINTSSYSLAKAKTLDITTMLEEKRQIINKNDILTYWVCEDDISNVGGFDNLKEWFAVQMMIMDNPEAARAFMADQPKGIMILGVQGSGKTYIAKAIAKTWGKGVIKLDMGRVFAGLVGESEKRMRMALSQAEAAGGVVIIDEIDKGLAGAGSSDRTDGGTTKRVIGTLLTWMNEPHPGVFIVATANDISNILSAHPELLRKGRFDEIWFSDLPTESERKDIFDIHLRKRGRDSEKFDTNQLAKTRYSDKTGDYDYTGAEIEYAIKEAVSRAFAKGYTGPKSKLKIGGKGDVTTENIIEQLNQIKPIIKVGKNNVKKMREWAADNARNVSTQLEKQQRGKPKKKTGNLNLFNASDAKI